jgi:hypothetical protein
MRQGAVERTLGKLVTDAAFRARFFAEPALASLTAGLALSPVELEALAHLSPRGLAHFSRRLDERIRRLPVAAAPRSTPSGGLDPDDDRLPAESSTGRGTVHGARPPRAGEYHAPVLTPP